MLQQTKPFLFLTWRRANSISGTNGSSVSYSLFGATTVTIPSARDAIFR